MKTLVILGALTVTSAMYAVPATASCLDPREATAIRKGTELNHIGLSWEPVNHVPAGPAFIKQYVTLAQYKNHYERTFSIRQLEPDGKTLFTPAPTFGKIVASRATIDTDTQEPLPATLTAWTAAWRR